MWNQNSVIPESGVAAQGSSQLTVGAMNTRRVSTGKSQRSGSSKSSVKVRAKEIEADRDQKLLALKKGYADKLREKKSLEIRMRSYKRRLAVLGPRPEDEKGITSKNDMEKDVEDIEERLELIKVDLESMEATYKEEVAAINSQSELALAQISDDEYASLSDEEDTQVKARIQNWADKVEEAQLEDEVPPPRGSTGSGIQPNQTDHQFNEQTFHHGPSEQAQFTVPTFSTNYHHEAARPGMRVYQPAPPWERSQFHQNEALGIKPSCSRMQNWNPRQVTGPPTGPPPRAPPNNDAASALPPTAVDKDQMMMHIMNEQLRMMQVSQQGKRSYVDKKLPTFDGDPGMWINFVESYQRSTAKYKFDDEENMMRVQDALQGEARQAVLHLMVNPKNLKTVLHTLESRFGRADFIIEHCIQRLKSLKRPDLSKVESIDEFGRLVEALVVNVCSFNEQEYMRSKQLLTEIAEMMPAAWKQLWYEYLVSCGGTKQSLKTQLMWLKPKIEAVRLQMKPKVEADADKEKKRSRTRGPGAVNAVSGGDEEKKSSRGPCPACQKKNHVLASCWKFAKLPLDVKWKIVKEARFCVSCLQAGHRATNCTEGKKCTSCMRLHHPLLHGEREKQISEAALDEKKEEAPVSVKQDADTKKDVKSSATGVISVAIIEGCDGPLQMVKIIVKGKNGNKRVFAMLDGGATRSLIKRSLAEQLGITGEKVDYKYNGINGQTVIAKNAMKVNFDVSGDFRGAKFLPLHTAMTVDEIHMRPYSFNLDEARKHWPHLKKIKGLNIVKIVPDVIIGNNNPHLTLPKQVVRGSLYEPVGIRTPLGWTVSGDFDTVGGDGKVNVVQGTDDYLHELIKQSFSLESFGVRIPVEKGINLDEKRAYGILDRTTKKTGSAWETGLLWCEDDIAFPDSYRDAYKRLVSTERRMEKDPVFRKMYLDKINECKEKGYIRKLSQDEVSTSNPKTWIIPHFGVTNENKPGKFRFIMDAKAKSNGVSLNDKLLKGPDLIRPLIAVLLNFRIHPVAITGDIADMFHRVKIRMEDQPSQHFIWRNGEKTREPDHYVMEVMIFGATSSPSSAIFVKNKNAKLFENQYPEAYKAIVENMYVDDMLLSVATVSDAIRIREEISEINEAGGFIIRKWISNSQEVLASIPEDLRADGVKDLEEHSELPTERVLGLWWDANQDVFTFRLNLHKVPKEVIAGKRPTKREICSLVMSLYDPLGFINHYKVKGMMLLQETWRSGIIWDDEVSTSIFEMWTKWLSLLPEITTVKVPRMYSANFGDATSVELHTFVDSSEESYCAVCYLRVQRGEAVDVVFVTSKVRVAPLKKTTIPRLELQAALLGSRTANSVEAELQIAVTGRRFWSDSKTVLLWIRSRAKRYKEFVANRIGEIQETTNIHEWSWVPTALNVADVATRFTGEISFAADGVWYSGPAFLKEEKSKWPKEKIEEEGVIASTLLEYEEKGSDCEHQSNGIGFVIPKVTRFSSYQRLLRATAAVKACGLY